MINPNRFLSTVAVLSPPPVGISIGTGVFTSNRFGTPEHCLSLVATIVRRALPYTKVIVASGRRLAKNEIPKPKSLLYEQIPLFASTFPDTQNELVNFADNASLVLISATLTQEASGCLCLIRALKARDSSQIIVVGGTDATFRPSIYLSAGADLIVIGEGEYVLSILLKRLLKGADVTAVPNLAWLSKNGEIQFSKQNSHELQSLSLPSLQLQPSLEFSNVLVGEELHEGKPPMGVSERSVYLETSRGCRPGNCGFCSCGPKTGGATGYRVFSLATLVAFLEEIGNVGIRTLQIIDDNILSRCDYEVGDHELYDILFALRLRHFAWEFATGLQLSRLLRHGRPRQDLIDALFSPQLMPNGQIVGGYRLFVPFETALRPRRPKNYHNWSKMQGVGMDEAISLLEAFDKSGVQMLSLGVMIGFPDDTMNDIDDTIKGMEAAERIIRSLNRQRLASGQVPMQIHWDIMIYMLLPGTTDYERYRHRILFDDNYETAPELLNFQTAAYRPYHIAPWELTNIRSEIAREFTSGEVSAGKGMKPIQHQYNVIR